jgi:putative oxidoreductase
LEKPITGVLVAKARPNLFAMVVIKEVHLLPWNLLRRNRKHFISVAASTVLMEHFVMVATANSKQIYFLKRKAMKNVENVLNLLGRIAIATLFLPAGLNKLMGVEGTTAYFNSLGLPLVSILVWVVIAIEVLGGIALIIGFKTQLVAVVLALFTLVASIVGHAFWAAPVDAVFIAQLLFFKNMAVLGGLLVLASNGAGAISLDGKGQLAK